MTVVARKGATPESIAPAVRAMQEKHQNMKSLNEKAGEVELQLRVAAKFFSIRRKYDSYHECHSTIVLFVSIMNYLLLTVSTLITA